MQLISSIVLAPIAIAATVLLHVLFLIYMIDLVLAGWLLLVIFLSPLLLLPLYWAALAVFSPLLTAMDESSEGSARVVGLVLVPVGLVLGFLLWQVSNWVIYGVLDADPRLYNWVFRRLGLAI